MTRIHAPQTDTPPQCWERAYEEPEPEVYYIPMGPTEPRGHQSPGKWTKCFLSVDDAVDYGRPGTEFIWETPMEPILDAVRYRGMMGAKVLARDADGWFVLREVPA